jgi:hypothetical protein
MRKYNFFHNNVAITRKNFEANVPKNWESQIENFEYSSGYYRAVELN